METKLLRGLLKELQAGLKQRTPDIAGLVAFLAGEEGRWITNEKLRCDGGIR